MLTAKKIQNGHLYKKFLKGQFLEIPNMPQSDLKIYQFMGISEYGFDLITVVYNPEKKTSQIKLFPGHRTQSLITDATKFRNSSSKFDQISVGLLEEKKIEIFQ